MSERKPVAWVCTRQTTDAKKVFDEPVVASNPAYVKAHPGHDWTPLYTRPAPLTDEQITAIFMTYGTGRGDGFAAAVRAVEAALWGDGE